VRKQQYSLACKQPLAAHFLRLRSAVGWVKLNVSLVKRSLTGSLFHVTAYDNNQLLGIGHGKCCW